MKTDFNTMLHYVLSFILQLSTILGVKSIYIATKLLFGIVAAK